MKTENLEARYYDVYQVNISLLKIFVLSSNAKTENYIRNASLVAFAAVLNVPFPTS